MLHGSETWPVRKENVVALQRAEMRMVCVWRLGFAQTRWGSNSAPQQTH